jgi:hypothetical protein
LRTPDERAAYEAGLRRGTRDAAEDHERLRIVAEQERLDALRAVRANRSKWKNARRDFLTVRDERDAAYSVLRRCDAELPEGLLVFLVDVEDIPQSEIDVIRHAVESPRHLDEEGPA